MTGRRSAVVVLLMLSTACSPTTLKTVADTPSSSQPSADAPTDTPTSQPPPAAAGIGDTITLAVSDGGQVQMTALKVIDPAKSSNEYIQPEAGNRYVAVRFRIHNVGPAVFEDSPSNGAKIIDRDDQQHDASLFDAVEPGLGSLKIAPGASRVGFITFEVPKAAKVKIVQWTPESGFGDETGEWILS